MAPLTIFFAWQSDTKKTTKDRNFIKDAATKAAKRYQATAKLTERPAIDSDIEGVAGTPAIADTILEKIIAADLFLYDATLVHRKGKRASPNPNVLVELGFAVGKLGWPLVIGAMNEAHASAELLPFDLQHRRRPIVYTLVSGASAADRKIVKAKLVDDLEGAFRLAHEARLATLRHTPLDRLVAHRVRDAATSGVQHLSQLAVHSGIEQRVLSRFALLLMGARNSVQQPTGAEIEGFVDALLVRVDDPHPEANEYQLGSPGRFSDGIAVGVHDGGEMARIALHDLGTQARPELALPLARLILLQREAERFHHFSSAQQPIIIGDSRRSCLIRIVRELIEIQAAWTKVLAW